MIKSKREKKSIFFFCCWFQWNRWRGHTKWNRIFRYSFDDIFSLRRCQQINKLQILKKAQKRKPETIYVFTYFCFFLSFLSLFCVTLIQFFGICLANVKAQKKDQTEIDGLLFRLILFCVHLKRRCHRIEWENYIKIELNKTKRNDGKILCWICSKSSRFATLRCAIRINCEYSMWCACHHQVSDEIFPLFFTFELTFPFGCFVKILSLSNLLFSWCSCVRIRCEWSFIIPNDDWGNVFPSQKKKVIQIPVFIEKIFSDLFSCFFFSFFMIIFCCIVTNKRRE